MALYWPFMRRTALLYGLTGHPRLPEQAFRWYAAFLALLVVTVAVAVIAERVRGDMSLQPRVALLLPFAALAGCKCAELFLQPKGLPGMVLSCLDIGLYAVAVVLLTYAWATAFVSIGQRPAAFLALVSFAASLPVRFIWTIPGSMGTVVVSALPLLSLLLWYGASRMTPFSRPEGPSSGRGVSGKLLLVVVILFLFAGALVRGLIYELSSLQDSPSDSLQDLLTLACIAVLLVYCTVGTSSVKFYQVSWSAAAIVVFAGLLAMATVPDFGFRMGGGAVVVGRTCLGVLFWIMLVDLVRLWGSSLTRVFAVFLLVEVASSFLSYMVIPEYKRYLSPSLASDAAPFLAGLTLVLVVVTMVFFNRLQNGSSESDATGGVAEASEGGSALGEAPNEHENQFKLFGLTEREVEVARLLAAGNSQKKMAELLCVSIGTIQSHIRAIYRKFDIHSRQELIDLLGKK